jgi:hypothetical protein
MLGENSHNEPLVCPSLLQLYASIIAKANEHWKTIHIFHLRENMRSRGDEPWRSFLLELGDGKLPISSELSPFAIRLPDDICAPDGSNCSDLIAHTFPELLAWTERIVADPEGTDEREFFCGRALLTPTNKVVDTLNAEILSQFPPEAMTTYFSVDSVDAATPEETALWPLDFLHSLTPSGMPPHELILAPGVLIMLLRNIDADAGLCNGVRAVVLKTLPHVLDVVILSGTKAGKRVYIPRVMLAPKNPDLPFILRRRQFPVKLAWTMTINKAQGQTLARVGLYLASSVFSHGQLYVALSRVGSSNNIRVLVETEGSQGRMLGDPRVQEDGVYTDNVVWPEVLAERPTSSGCSLIRTCHAAQLTATEHVTHDVAAEAPKGGFTTSNDESSGKSACPSSESEPAVSLSATEHASPDASAEDPDVELTFFIDESSGEPERVLGTLKPLLKSANENTSECTGDADEFGLAGCTCEIVGSVAEEEVVQSDVDLPVTGSSADSNAPRPVYTGFFQLQMQAQCAMHALNNALGFQFVTIDDMQKAARLHVSEQRFEGNPELLANHCTRTGFYSEAVMTCVLRMKIAEQELGNHFRAKMDVDNPVQPNHNDAQRIYEQNALGVIVNLHQTHWTAFRIENGQIWLLDSLEAAPIAYSFEAFVKYLRMYRNAFLVTDED